jgi:hypothetical protein
MNLLTLRSRNTLMVAFYLLYAIEEYYSILLVVISVQIVEISLVPP